MELDLKIFKHNAKGLWFLVGEFLCSRAVAKELGGQIFSSEETVWFVAINGKSVVGFCLLSPKAGKYWVDCAYVLPEHRHKGVHKKLAAERQKYILTLESRPIAVCCRKERWQHYEKQGFTISSERGSWIYGEKNVAAK